MADIPLSSSSPHQVDTKDSRTITRNLACSTFSGFCTGAVVYPVDIVKTHILKGIALAEANKLAFKRFGLSFGLIEMTLISLNVSQHVIDSNPHFSPVAKGMTYLAPLSILPIASCFNMLKVNSQVKHYSVRDCLAKVRTGKQRYSVLSRGMVPYCAIPTVFLGASLTPFILDGKSQGTKDVFTAVNMFGAFLITTYLEIVKVRQMLGYRGIAYKKISMSLFGSAWCVNVVYNFGFLLGYNCIFYFTDAVLTAREKRKQKQLDAAKFQAPTAFEDMIPEETESFDINKVINDCELKVV